MAHEVETMAWTGEKPWHGLGTQVPGLMKTGEALRIADLDWEVKLSQLTTANGNVMPNNFAVERHKGDKISPLGVVGSRYTPVNNVEAFSFFDDVLGKSQAQIETAASLKNGAKVFMMAKLPEVDTIIDGDNIERYLLVSTSHDGSEPVRVAFTNVRVVCNNTLTWAIQKAKNMVVIRHTKNYKDKLLQAKNVLAQSDLYWEKQKNLCQYLASNRFDRVQVTMFMDAMFPLKKVKSDVDKFRNNKARETVYDLMQNGLGTDISGVKGSAWGMINAFTEYQDHHKSVRGDANRWERSVMGGGVLTRQKALNTVLELVK